MTGLFFGKMVDTFVEEAERRVRRGSLTELRQNGLLTIADDGKLAHFPVSLRHHIRGNRHNAFGQCLPQLRAVERVVILYHHTAVLYLDIDLEFRHI